MKSGFEVDLAFSIDPIMRTAFCIIFNQIEGGKFDWDTMSFEDPK